MEQTVKNHREIHPSLRTPRGSRLGIRAAGTYLAASGTLSVYSMLNFTGPDANLAGVIPYLMTAPWSLLPLTVLNPESDTPVSDIIFMALPVIGALINAVLVHTLARKLSTALSRYRLNTGRATQLTGTTLWSAARSGTLTH